MKTGGIAALALLAMSWGGTARAETGGVAKLSHQPEFILGAIAAKMDIALRKEVPLPKLYHSSLVPIEQYQRAIRSQSNMLPQKVVNAYILADNAIYLNDAAEYYGQNGRSLDDSLAHEYAHYLQVRYRGYGLDDMNEDSAEEQAVLLQFWFRDNYVSDASHDAPPAVTRPEKTAAKNDCGIPGIVVTSEEPETGPLACDGVLRAVKFMGGLGYDMPVPLTVRIADRFPERYYTERNDDGSPKYDLDNVYGFYETDTSEIFMKPYSQFLRTSPEHMISGLPPSRELYVSYIAHEAAHHISIGNFSGGGRISHLYSEFISYAAQLETLATKEREEIIRRFRLAGRSPFDSAEQINPVLYGMDPQGFAVKCWLLFDAPGGGALIKEIMSGKPPPSASLE